MSYFPAYDTTELFVRHAGYMTTVMSPERVVAAAEAYLRGQLEDKRVAGVTLVGTGLSGAMVVPLLAYLHQVQFAVLRKRNDNSHSFADVNILDADAHLEGVFVNNGYWFFVDDIIASGATYHRVCNAIAFWEAQKQMRLTFGGCFLYGGDFSDPCFFSSHEQVQDHITYNC